MSVAKLSDPYKANKAREIRETDRAIRALKRDGLFFDHLKNIGKYPHDGQKKILSLLVNANLKELFLQCSRNFGKSHMLRMDAVLTCMRYPRSKYYIIAPYRSQGYEIHWASGDLQEMIPPGELKEGEKGINKSELRLTFKNGSFIKIDGADNIPALRGYKPTRLGADEFQDWQKEAWDTMQPNLLAHEAAVIKIGTPPDRENHFTIQAEEVRRKMLRGSRRHLFLQRTIYDNPLISKESIEELRQGFVERGEFAIFRREYLAEFVPGGASSIYPQFNRGDHIRPYDWIKAQLDLSGRDATYLTVFDPSSTRFAVGLYAYDKAHGRMFLLREIVESDRLKISAGQIWPRVQALEKEVFPAWAEPVRVYDEAATLFANEMAYQYGVPLVPTDKKQNEKSNNISLVRDAMVRNALVVCDECPIAIWEFFNFHTDEKGKIVKEKDDMMDTCLYAFAESGYMFQPGKLSQDGASKRTFTPEEDFIRRDKDSLEVSPRMSDDFLGEEDFSSNMFDFDLWN